ncbi:hypothetical protein M2326_003262 [Flavobacterium sp. 7A]|nr:hypothetical protein [Flavobacterium sp. 7A]
MALNKYIKKTIKGINDLLHYLISNNKINVNKVATINEMV